MFRRMALTTHSRILERLALTRRTNSPTNDRSRGLHPPPLLIGHCPAKIAIVERAVLVPELAKKTMMRRRNVDLLSKVVATSSSLVWFVRATCALYFVGRK